MWIWLGSIAGPVARSKSIFLTAATVAALGVGLSVASLSILDAMVVKPLPYPDSARLFVLLAQDARSGVESKLVSYAAFLSLRDGAQGRWQTDFTEGPYLESTQDAGGLHPLWVLRVTGGYLESLGVVPVVGRSIRATDCADRARVGLISYALWRARFGGAEVIGQPVRLGAATVVIVGVLPEFTKLPVLGSPPDVVIPIALGQSGVTRRRVGPVLFRLNVSASITDAERMVGVTVDRATRGVGFVDERLRLVRLQEELFKQGRTVSIFVVVAVGAVLLLAWTNLLLMSLSSASSLDAEVSIRIALGSPRIPLIRLVTSEALALGIVGGAAGLVMATGVLSAVNRWAGIPEVTWLGLTISGRAVFVTTVLSVVSAGVSAFVPAVRLRSLTLASGVRMSAVAGTTFRRRFGPREFAVACQVITTVVLLSAAIGSTLTVADLRRAELGFLPRDVWTFRVPLTLQHFPTTVSRLAFVQRLTERLSHQPSVLAVGAIDHLPLVDEPGRLLTRRSRYLAETGLAYSATPGFFSAIGMSFMAGRSFGQEAVQHQERVVVVNEAAVRRYWNGADPLGKMLDFGAGIGPVAVVGVVRDTRLSFGDPAVPMAFLPFDGAWVGQAATFVVKAVGSSQRVASRIEIEINAAQPGLYVLSSSLDARLAVPIAQPTAVATVLGMVSLVSCFLAATGLFGLVNYQVVSRTREIAIRLALGARSPQICKAVLGRVVALVGTGFLTGSIGLPAIAAIVGRVAGRTPRADAAVVALTALLLVSAVALAVVGPIRRALGVNPARQLADSGGRARAVSTAGCRLGRDPTLGRPGREHHPPDPGGVSSGD